MFATEVGALRRSAEQYKAERDRAVEALAQTRSNQYADSRQYQPILATLAPSPVQPGQLTILRSQNARQAQIILALQARCARAGISQSLDDLLPPGLLQ
jgi:hypothetical protein